MSLKFFNFFKMIFLVNFTSCAYIHRVAINDIDVSEKNKYYPFEVKVSETGWDLKQAGDIVDTIGWHGDDRYKQLMEIVSMFQMGPRTGNPVFNDQYANKIYMMLKEKCPSGVTTGLMQVRESASYPVVSGEIIRIRGYCKA